MKVKCINKRDWAKIIIGKTYDVIKYSNDKYKIIDDNDQRWYPKEWFKTLSEIRNEKIDKLLK